MTRTMIWWKANKSQIFDKKMHQALKILMEEDFDGSTLWWKILMQQIISKEAKETSSSIQRNYLLEIAFKSDRSC